MNKVNYLTARFDVSKIEMKKDFFEVLRADCKDLYKVNLSAFAINNTYYLCFVSSELEQLTQSIAHVFFNLNPSK